MSIISVESALPSVYLSSTEYWRVQCQAGWIAVARQGAGLKLKMQRDKHASMFSESFSADPWVPFEALCRRSQIRIAWQDQSACLFSSQCSLTPKLIHTRSVLSQAVVTCRLLAAAHSRASSHPFMTTEVL